MAAEVPVCDVLCEAMEYLSKLGSNLRSRSENLKEKRISKNKLRNAHAVNKAAQKVLLICELSKKSLENVEIGVRKVLSLVNAGQAHTNNGGKQNDKKSEHSNKRFHYFNYESYKLRISKKISIAHFTSVKVLAKTMPDSMQEKYPVFYDCKLKQLRKQLSEDLSEDELEKKERRGSCSSDKKQKIEKSNKNQNEFTKLLESDESECGKSSKNEETEKNTKDSNKTKSLDVVINSNPEDVIDDEINNSISSLNMRDDICEQGTDEKTNANLKSKIGQDSVNSKEDTAVSELIECFANEAKVVENKTNSVKTKSIRKKFSKIKITDDSSEDDEPLKNKKVNENQPSPGEENDDNEKNITESEPKSKKRKISNADDNSKSKDDSDHSLIEANNSENDSKPLIRCVNITKLLKPDVLESKISNSSKDRQMTKNDHLMSKGRVRKNSANRNTAQHEDRVRKSNHIKDKKSDDEFWALKRNEVKKFKPKKFTINVSKLPQLTINFLISHNLQKITHRSKTICEVTKAKDKETDNLEKNIDEVKNALLNESGSEDIDNVLTAEANEVKNTLLNDSDSDAKEQTSEKTENIKAKANKVKNTLLTDSDSDAKEQTSEKTENIKAKANKVKNTLLNDSDAKEQTSEKAENIKAKANKVKNTLLNDSDSDAQEQTSENTENITTKANKIKNTLLNDSDSDAKEQTSENNENSNQRKKDELTDTAAIKDALLNESDSENNELDKVETNKTNKSAASGDDGEKELETEVTDKIKSALLNDSDSDKNQNDNVADKCNENVTDKNLSENESGKTEQCELTQDPEKIKSSLLNDSSDSGEKLPVIIKKKKLKMSKHKREHGSKRMRTKKKPVYSSTSSENEEENSQESEKGFKKHTHKHTRRKSRISSSEDCKKEHSSRESDSKGKGSKANSSNEDKDSETIDQIDGTIDEHSDSSVGKMVRSKAKPSGSSGQNSDNQDASDKEIDGLTNLNNLNKPHRRRDPPTNNTGSRKSSRTKPTPNIGEDLLRAVSSSDVTDEDNMEDEDLPPVNLSGLNGDSISHLAKDDLLGESDTSVSQKGEHSEAEESHNVEDSEEENVKLKRQRKANAISSDSEGGTSHRKQRDADVKLSDFEDSEDESSESIKRAKRKKKGSESEASAGSSNEGGTKKRRRIKSVKESDGSGSDTENEGRNKHGRKNIRKVMGKNQLEEATKKAAREEKERVARILERQKLYNNLEFDESGKPDEVTLEKVILDFDPETKEPLIEVDRGLVKKLKPHQANGIKFMWNACFESVKRIKKDKGSGCILAHCMGLGKTLQVISLTHTLLIHGSLTGVNRVLVVCPLSTVLNWVNEFKMWLKHAHSEFEVDVYELSRYKQNSERAFQLQQWFEGGGVCVLGYEMFRNLSSDNNKKFKKKMLRSFQEALVDPGPDLVVCDEGHLLKNEKTSLSQSMNKVKTRRRIVLTGTPLQNNLKEYYCMVQFVKPNLLGKYNEYLNRFVNPITNGQYTDSTEGDIKVMKRRSHVLHKMLDGAVQRRDYGVLAPFLPPKHEYVLFITLSDVQVKLYQHYLDNYSRRPLPGKSSGFLFPDFQSLQRIWTHPLVLKYNSERYEIMQQKKREREEEDSEGSLVDFIDDDSTPDETSTEESSDDLSDVSDDSRKKSKKKNKAKKSKSKDKDKESKVGTRRGTRANPVEIDDEDADVTEVVEARNENPTEWWIKLVDDEELDDMRNSHKLVLLFDILRQCEAIGDKLLVFSQSLYSLDLIEHFLGKVDEATQEGRIDEKLGGHVGSWSPGVDYFRLDGSTSCENRSIWCKNFNREDNPRARLFLISTRAGGLGINLVAANRVVIFDVSWNPSHDVQSIFRVYRFGQKKPCYVYRFLAMGTMEEKIYERQVTKQAISKRVIDEQQIDRHYAENDLAELYKFEARPEEPRPLPSLPKDRLFAEMLREHEAQIYKYHEHDSLLENKEEETLSEEERKAAWEDFENEKNKPPPAPFPSAWPMHNGMVPNLLAQQQQQLAYAALAAMLRKDMPNINDNQIRDMLPLIYNSNPGLMQKMSEIYKYTQPGMMNHGMMNPAMNQAAAGGAMSGTSGLQYEPPWQRQQQQQNQMRLQQLMQQNQMGAKFYAGGLGSRDPVAMALQQQRAREIMMGGGAGRPRGRPPLAPRLPPAPAQDVVNLDSD
ncbi:hypothetical protein PYW07_012388 [Mythimna separata]|uniref:DNA helicase n=1 Tax=Mythimna separata TaxID=271217 RepID=A0AAD8DST1_MYTSE|nr:hypothetical protein PYW07_012388 [Mythimna separata]